MYKFSRFLMVPFDREAEAVDFFSRCIRNGPEIKNISAFFKTLTHKYLLVYDEDKSIRLGESSLRCLLDAMRKEKAGMAYSNYCLWNGRKAIPHLLMDYQLGSIRENFHFGPLLFFSCEAIKSVIQNYGSLPFDQDTALYDLRLKISIDHKIIRVPKSLYSVVAKRGEIESTRQPEAHFAYAVKQNLSRQKKFEKIATNHLKRVGAYLGPRKKTVIPPSGSVLWKASIILPVYNRKKTIADALESALIQKTDFPFNVLVVDNHSTDGTTDLIEKFAIRYPHIHHIIPVGRDLGIGGCWNEAIESPYCGQYAVQLDSDDWYSSSQTLQKIIDRLRSGNYAMVVGSYTVVNAQRKKIFPGLVDHREWTTTNGHNNLLRVNGVGAPRAFDVSVIRRMGFPNVSYGEDYAVALRISREYKIGRIFENVYECRRWKNNTDAKISPEQENRNNFYKDQLRSEEIKSRQNLNEKWKRLEAKIWAGYPGKVKRSLASLCDGLYDVQKKDWPAFAQACRGLRSVRMRRLSGGYPLYLQYNAARIVSSAASVDADVIKQRPCFLCPENLPVEQKGILYRDEYLILCNPAPIFKNHFTVIGLDHDPQKIKTAAGLLIDLARDVSPKYAVLYNGPACGASAPDHLHVQMVSAKDLPFLRERRGLTFSKKISAVEYKVGRHFDRCVTVLESKREKFLREQFLDLLTVAQRVMTLSTEPMLNVLCVYEQNRWRLIIFWRARHRPAAYFAKGKQRIFISPGAIDMAGVVISPLLRHYKHLCYHDIREIYKEVSLPENMSDFILKQL